MSRFRPRVYADTTISSSSPLEQEESLAETLKGKRQPGSGSSVYAKGDVLQKSNSVLHQPEKFLIEAKQTEAASIRIQATWLTKITEEAHAAGREPALAFEIKGAVSHAEMQWVAVPLSVFRRLCDPDDCE